MKIQVTLPLNERQKERLEMNFRHLEFCYCLQKDVTEEVIRDKVEIEQEIETTITSAKSETMVMLIMPIVIVVAMSSMGGGLLESLFTTLVGHICATVALIIFGISYVLAVKSSKIEV